MHVYAVTYRCDPESVVYQATLADAHAHVRDSFEPVFRPDARITLLDLKTDKGSLVWLLNNPSGLRDLIEEAAIRIWTVSRRGGIKEIDREHRN